MKTSSRLHLPMKVSALGSLGEGGSCPGQPGSDESPQQALGRTQPSSAGRGVPHAAALGPLGQAPALAAGFLPARVCGGSSCSQTGPVLADKILISLLRSPECDPIFMSELGNELHLSSPFSTRKVSRGSG